MRYRFEGFVLSPRTRTLTRAERPVPLIPRYLDLLLLLVARRREAVSRHAILDAVWSDVVVSEGAISQAVRTLRRALGDDPREPRYIRTVSRHGYQFIFPEVVEEDEATAQTAPAAADSEPSSEDAFERAIERLLSGQSNGSEGDARLDAAETLHGLGTAEALRRLGTRPGHARARALLREARWDVLGAGPVPLLGQPGALQSVFHLVRLRLRRVLREIEGRWAGAAMGGALAGLLAGAAGGLALLVGPGSRATGSLPFILGLLGAAVGASGAAGVGAGLAAAEAVFRSARGLMLIVLGSLGGGAVGALGHALALWAMEGLFGRAPSPIVGGLEGLALGGGAALGYALVTHPHEGGMPTPHGVRRLGTALMAGLGCAGAGLALSLTGCHMGAMSLDFLARSFPGSQVSMEPLARLLGEPTAGGLTSAVISTAEGGVFGFGLALGLTRRPR